MGSPHCFGDEKFCIAFFIFPLFYDSHPSHLDGFGLVTDVCPMQ